MTGAGDAIEDTAVECFTDGQQGEITQCVVDATFAAGPAPSLVGLLLGGSVITSLYIAGNGDVTVPAVVTILLGAAMVPLLPAQFTTLAYTVVVIGITAAAFAAWTRFTHQGGF